MMSTRNGIYEAEILTHIEKMQLVLDNYRNKTQYDVEDYLGIERALQILIESLIGFSRYVLKVTKGLQKAKTGEVLDDLLRFNLISQDDYELFKKMIGYRNILVHDCLTINPGITMQILDTQQYYSIKQVYLNLIGWCEKAEPLTRS